MQLQLKHPARKSESVFVVSLRAAFLFLRMLPKTLTTQARSALSVCTGVCAFVFASKPHCLCAYVLELYVACVFVFARAQTCYDSIGESTICQ